MHARVSSYRFPSGEADEVIAAFDGDDRLERMPGVLEAYLLIDRDASTALTLTLWADEAAVRDSEAAADRVREDASRAAGGSVRSVQRYEVALHERFGAGIRPD